MQTKERKERKLGVDERVAIWVSRPLRKILLIEKTKRGCNNMDSLIRSLLD